MGPSLPFSFSLSLIFYLLYYSCDSCAIYLGFFFAVVATNCPVPFAIFAHFLLL